MAKIYAMQRSALGGILGCLSALALLCLAAPAARAQVTSYSFSRVQGAYTPLTIAAGDMLAQDPNVDDNTYTVNLGFTFRYSGVDYTQVTVSNNGAVAFGPGNGYSYTQIADGTGFPQLGDIFDPANSTYPTDAAAVMAPLALDIRMDADSYLGVARAGTAPNRTFTVEWAHERRYDASDGVDDDFNFQVVLFEGSNVIEFRYGTFAFTSRGFEPQVGIRGHQATDVINIAAPSGGFPAATRVSDLVARIVVTDPSTAPQSGTIFRFAPIPPAPNDLGVVGFVSPRPDQTSCLLSSQERVRVAVRNFGTNPQTGVAVSFRLGNGQVISENFSFTPSPLQPNNTDTVTFSLANSVNMSTVGVYSLKSWTNLATEPAPNHVNDTTNFAINLTGPILPPANPLGTLSAATAAQWKEAQGRNIPSGTTSNWGTGFPFASETYALIFDEASGTNRDNNEWLLSPNYNLPSGGFFMIFKAAMTMDAFGSSPIASIGDDTVKVMVSSDCGVTWRTMIRFSQADLASGRIDNTLKEFRFPLSASATSLRVAFFGTSNGTPAADTWRFHIDDIEFKEVIPTDLGVTRILAPASGQPGCLLGTQETVTVVVKNYGSAPQTSSPMGYRLQSGATLGPEVAIPSVTFTPALAPGAEDTVSFTGALGANLSVAGTYSILAYTKLPGETVTTARNDTGKSEDIRISNPYNLPAPNIGSNGNATTNGWSKGRGLDRPTGNTSGWGFASAPGAEYIGLTMSATAATPLREWIYSPSYAGTDYTTILFRAGVIAGGSGSPAPNGMEDDTVSLKVSNDCGATWRTIRKFTQADVTAGVLGNTLNEFSALVPSPGQRISFGFFADNRGTVSQANYRFVLDDIRIKNASQNDVGVVRATSPITNTAQCTQACTQPTIVIRNYGAANQASATISYSVNGGPVRTETITLSPALAPGATDTVTFGAANCADMSAPGTYTFTFFATTGGEDSAATRNDTLRNYMVDTRAAEYVTPGGTLIEAFDANIRPGVLLPAGWSAERQQALLDWQQGLGRGANQSDGVTARLNANNRYSWLASPRYTIPAGSGTVLQFDYRIVEQRGQATILGAGDSMLVEISTNCAQTWQRLGAVNMGNHVQSDDHRMLSYPLDNYAGQEAVFRVQVWANRTDPTGALFDIDNWRVGAPVAAKGKVAGLAYRLAPNPARDRVTLTGPAGARASVTVVSALGQTVLSAMVDGTETSLDLSGLTPGMYRVRIAPEQGGKPAVLTLVKE